MKVPRRRRWLRAVLGVVVALAATGCSVWVFRMEIAAFWFEPRFAFDAHPPPPAPEYARPEAWAALPERRDDADFVPPGESDARTNATADVFFVHPTTYLSSSSWNQPLDDAVTNERTDRRVMRSQASAINACCRVYAPRYRQATLFAFMSDHADGDRARDLAYADVARAFDAFLARIGPDRPIVLGAHSQGSHHVLRLLEDRFAGKPLAAQLVAAYLVGMPMPADKLERTLNGIPLCASAKATGCLVTWGTVGPNADRTRFWDKTRVRYPNGWESNHAKQLACVNPLSWHSDEQAAPASANFGAVILPHDDATPVPVQPAVTGARCDGGLLVVTEALPRRFRELQLARQDYHVYDYSLFWKNVRQNAVVRVEAFAAGHAAKP